MKLFHFRLFRFYKLHVNPISETQNKNRASIIAKFWKTVKKIRKLKYGTTVNGYLKVFSPKTLYSCSIKNAEIYWHNFNSKSVKYFFSSLPANYFSKSQPLKLCSHERVRNEKLVSRFFVWIKLKKKLLCFFTNIFYFILFYLFLCLHLLQ